MQVGKQKGRDIAQILQKGWNKQHFPGQETIGFIMDFDESMCSEILAYARG